MLNLIFKMQNLSDFSYFLLNIRKVLVNWNFLAHFYASNFVNKLFLQRSQPVAVGICAITPFFHQAIGGIFFNKDHFGGQF